MSVLFSFLRSSLAFRFTFEHSFFSHLVQFQMMRAHSFGAIKLVNSCGISCLKKNYLRWKKKMSYKSELFLFFTHFDRSLFFCSHMRKANCLHDRHTYVYALVNEMWTMPILNGLANSHHFEWLKIQDPRHNVPSNFDSNNYVDILQPLQYS